MREIGAFTEREIENREKFKVATVHPGDVILSAAEWQAIVVAATDAQALIHANHCGEHDCCDECELLIATIIGKAQQ